MQLLSGLLAAGVPSSDIGIISPYKAQVSGFDQSNQVIARPGQLWQLLPAAGIKVGSAQQSDASGTRRKQLLELPCSLLSWLLASKTHTLFCRRALHTS